MCGVVTLLTVSSYIHIKSETPQCLKLVMMIMYKVDKVACLCIAAEDGIVQVEKSFL